MDDDALSVEMVHLNEELALIQADIDNYDAGRIEREETWRKRVMLAVAAFERRIKLCRHEIETRNRQAKERRRQAQADREAESAARRKAKQLAKQQNVTAFAVVAGSKQRRLATREAAFVRVARKMLPPETWRAIWDAVDAEAPQREEPQQ